VERGGTYLLTWTTYGTWLPGDGRGFVGRVRTEDGSSIIHNIPGEPYDADEPDLQRGASSQLKGPPVYLSTEQAGRCTQAFRETCEKYGLDVHGGSVMRTHVHLVVASDGPEGAKLLNLFKGIAARRLGQHFGKRASGSWWTTGGSRRLLPSAQAIEDAIHYVRNQEYILASFEYSCPRSGDQRPMDRPLDRPP